ncbi:MAG TPA: SPOR domain-containing protein [Allosphingosinicella sp.]|uniref:SPOR domain-containing protein n=1 Tax=Allosphingosinicella sp. TaxID=2823234 RepID=UPI002ED84FBB
MISLRAGRFLWSAGLLATGLHAGVAGAQNVRYPSGAVVQPMESGAATTLANHVRTLAAMPKNLTALLGAGNAALELGDTQAALAFFARAEEVAPRDGRVKAGMGSAFAHNMQPQAALKFFAEAAAAGAPASLYIKDRGLAYDMIGDPARAQADYAAALLYNRDPEVERRMALSKAISGDKAGALALLAPQLQRQERAAWRANAFVLALTGDTEGAINAVRTAMPSQTVAIRPFLVQLPQLSAADKALAVHFGHFPQGARFASAATPQQPAAVPSITPAQPDVQQPAPKPVRTADASQPRRPTNFELAGRGVVSRTTQRPASTTVNTTPAATMLPPVTTAAAAVPVQVSQPVQLPPAQPVAAAELLPSEAQAQAPLVPVPEPVATPASAPASSSRLNFADVAAVVQSLPDLPAEKAEVAEKPAAAKKAEAKAPAKKAEPAKTAEAKTQAKKEGTKTAAKKAEPAKPKEPSRIWVQLAAAQNKAAFGAEFKRLKGKAPKLLDGKTAWTAPYRATNRLLVGPFKTEKEAREFVNELNKASISSFSWTSDAGQAIEKLTAK